MLLLLGFYALMVWRSDRNPSKEARTGGKGKALHSSLVVIRSCHNCKKKVILVLLLEHASCEIILFLTYECKFLWLPVTIR